MPSHLPHATERLPAWREGWGRTGRIVLLLDFDGTLAPIVERPEEAEMPSATRAALERLREMAGVEMAVVSGRGMVDARNRAALRGIAYAGNHGMEIEGAGLRRIHREAAAARPALDVVARRLESDLAAIDGAIVEDKGLTLSIHYRRVARDQVAEVRKRVLAASAERNELKVTEGKEVLEVRPAVDWDKGKAVEFIVGEIDPPPGCPVIYLGDDTTDEDAFQALGSWAGGSGEGVFVGEQPPAKTAAASYLRDPGEVADLLVALALPEDG
jgi:trehalose 6-phosphate phosphatase